MEVAIKKAQTQKVSVVGIVQRGHIGRLGEYVELAASKGLISMMWGGGQGVRPAADPMEGGNACSTPTPWRWLFPVGAGSTPMMFDIATTGDFRR